MCVAVGDPTGPARPAEGQFFVRGLNVKVSKLAQTRRLALCCHLPGWLRRLTASWRAKQDSTSTGLAKVSKQISRKRTGVFEITTTTLEHFLICDPRHLLARKTPAVTSEIWPWCFEHLSAPAWFFARSAMFVMFAVPHYLWMSLASSETDLC
jgi:hypothetical protein